MVHSFPTSRPSALRQNLSAHPRPWYVYLFAASFILYFTLVILAERWGTGSWIYLENKRMVQALFLLAAACLAWRYSRHPAALIGAWILAAAGSAPVFPFEEMVEIWRHLPAGISVLLWLAQLSHFFMLPLFFLFYAMQPIPCFRGPAVWGILSIPAVVGSSWGIFHLYKRIYDPPYMAYPPDWIHILVAGSIFCYGVGGLAAMIFNYARLKDCVLQKKYRVFVYGSLIGWTPGFLFLMALFLGPLTGAPWVWFFVSRPYKLFSLALFALVPVVLAWAVLKDRIFDVGTDT